MHRQPLVTRRSFSRAALGTAAALALPALLAQPKPEKTRVSIAVGGKAALYYLPLTIAEQLGYFKAEGLDVEIADFPGGARAAQAMVSGSADVCAGAFEHTLVLQSRQQMVRAFVLQGRAPQIAFGVSARSPSGASLGGPVGAPPGGSYSMADLRGKRIGVSEPGSSTQMLASMVLAQAGVLPGEVSFVGVGIGAGAMTALRTGQIDAISNTDPVITMLEQRGELKILCDTRTLKGTTQLFGGSMPAACLYAADDFVQKNPNTCQALSNAIVHALKWLQTAGPRDILKTVPEAFLLGDRALYLASFNNVREAIALDGMIPDDGARTALRALASYDPAFRAGTISLAKTYTNEFARRARDRYKA